MSRRTRRLIAVAVTTGALLAAPSAWGHSVLIATEPANDAIVDESPERVLLRFNEGVEASLGSIQVFDGSGERVDAEEISRPSSREVVVGIDGELERGTYTVAWRAISADSDPINGAFVFHVQEPGPQPAGIAAQVLRDTPLLVSAFYTGGRFFAFLFLLLCAGGVASLAYALRSADARLHRRLHGLLAVFAGALAVVVLLGLPLQGAAAGGTGLGDAFGWDVVSAVADTRYGTVSLIQAVLALALVAVALSLRQATGRGRDTAHGAAAVLAAGLVFTPPFAGHASVEGPVAITADVAHVLAASVWVGGLAFVVLALVLALEERWPLATRSVPRFSTMAVVAVAILLVAGTINGYMQIRAWRGLWETQYGFLLLAKVALVIPLLAMGAFNNRYAVPRLRAGVAQPRERRRFLQTAGAELVVMVAIIGVTAVLVNAPPAKSEIDMHGPATAVVNFGDVEAHVSVEPGTAGRNEIHLMFEQPNGEMVMLEEVKVSATLASRGIGPIEFEGEQMGHAGEWRVENADLTIPGDWQLRIEARRGEFELLTETTSIPIREES
jgi:copper transport protein